MQFFPAPFKAPLRAFAALIFPFYDGKVVLCNICDRGWCIPSGRVEPNEHSCQAAKREALEEAGAVVECAQYIGCYRIVERCEVRWADAFVANVKEIGEIQVPEESLGMQLVTLDELPGVYYDWNELTAAVFAHATEIIERSNKL